MLPFEDRWSRQRRLAEVGTDGQQQLASAVVSLAAHDDVDVERDYLIRAGVGEVRFDSTTEPLPFPFGSAFEFAAPLSVARGAWAALERIRRSLDIRGRR